MSQISKSAKASILVASLGLPGGDVGSVQRFDFRDQDNSFAGWAVSKPTAIAFIGGQDGTFSSHYRIALTHRGNFSMERYWFLFRTGHGVIPETATQGEFEAMREHLRTGQLPIKDAIVRTIDKAVETVKRPGYFMSREAQQTLAYLKGVARSGTFTERETEAEPE